jgi:hypothetical protein
MSKTGINDVQDQIQEEWSPLFMQELRESTLLPAQVNKDYTGDIRKKNDSVTVTQLLAPKGELLDVGVDADSFSTETMQTASVKVTANKRAVAAFEFDDLIDLQTVIDTSNPEIRQGMVYAVDKQINDYLYSLIDLEAGDNHITAATMTQTAMQTARENAGINKWMKNKPWMFNFDPRYYGQMIADANLASTDFGFTDAARAAGQIGVPRWGFNGFEDNSLALSKGLAFHPDFLLLCTQTEARFKVSDTHSSKKFGVVLSVDLVFGAKPGINFEELHSTISTT